MNIVIIVTVTLRGGINKKNWYFLTFGQKGGGGVSAKAKKSYQKILRFFLTKGGVLPNPNGFYQIFWHNLLKKKGGFI